MVPIRTAAVFVFLGCSVACTGALLPAPRPRMPPEVWQSAVDRSHPLVGTLWSVGDHRAVTETELAARLGAARVVLVGETHDNPDHHLLEARVLQMFAERHPAPAVVFEMLDAPDQPAIDATLRDHPGDADALALAVAWASSGWPPWSLYRPVFEGAEASNAAILAGGINRRGAMRIASEGPAAFDAALDSTFRLHEAPPAEEQAALRREMAEAHCGLLPEAMLDSMTLVQRTRDALLASRLHDGLAQRHGALLVAGNGHVRRDRGVPAQLARAFQTASIAVGLLEVRAELATPDAYASAFDAPALPFDYVWFTPRASDVDHCAQLREHVKAHEGS
ncbi:MAG: ChaN family lipoprotein [Polyangiaceae bacterium]|nr:ChaN family lipoprotein [Polyangiaceae bacterium]